MLFAKLLAYAGLGIVHCRLGSGLLRWLVVGLGGSVPRDCPRLKRNRSTATSSMTHRSQTCVAPDCHKPFSRQCGPTNTTNSNNHRSGRNRDRKERLRLASSIARRNCCNSEEFRAATDSGHATVSRIASPNYRTGIRIRLRDWTGLSRRL